MTDLPAMPTPVTKRTEVKVTYTIPSIDGANIHEFTSAALFDHSPTDDELYAAQLAAWTDQANIWLNPVSQPAPTDEDLLATVAAQQQQAAAYIGQMSQEAQVAALTGVTQAVVDYTTTNLPDPIQNTVIAVIADQVQAVQPGV